MADDGWVDVIPSAPTSGANDGWIPVVPQAAAPVAAAPDADGWQDVSGPTIATPFKAAAQGVVTGTGKAIEGLGIAQQMRDVDILKAFDAIDAGQNGANDGLAMDVNAAIFRYRRATPEQRSAMRAEVSKDVSTAPPMAEAGQAIEKFGQENIPLSEGEQGSRWATVPGALGAAVPALGVMAAMRGRAPAGLGVGAGGLVFGEQMGADQFHEALAHGADLDTAFRAYSGGVTIGAGTMALPAGPVLSKIDSLSGGWLRRSIAAAALSGGVGAATAVVQQAVSNLQAKGLYDPERGLADNVGEAAITGGLAGAAIGAPLGAMAGKGRPGVEPPPETPTGATPPGAEPGPAAPAASPTTGPQLPQMGDAVGLKSSNGAPSRFTFEGAQDGFVWVRDENGVLRGVRADEFGRDLTAAPPPKTIESNPTTVGKVPDRLTEDVPMSVMDEFFLRPGVEPEIGPSRTPKPAVEAEKARQGQLADDGWVPVKTPEQVAKVEAEVDAAAPETIRLYRGTGKNIGEREEGNYGFFTTNLAKAKLYGDVSFVDIPKTKEALNSFAQGHYPDEYVTDNPKVFASLKPIAESTKLESPKTARVPVTREMKNEVADAIFGEGERAMSPEAEFILKAMPKDLREAADAHASFLRGREEGANLLDEDTFAEAYGGGSPHEAKAAEASKWLSELAEMPRPSKIAETTEAPIIGDGTRLNPIVAKTAADIETAAAKTVEPTEAQKESGNYQKGHVKVQGLDVAIENPKGSERTGVGADGKPWAVEMPAHYGYLKKTVGGDGEQVDVYLGDHPQSQKVFVVDQVEPKTGKFDEHKSMVGYTDEAQARAAYDAGFSDGSGPARRGNITAMSMDQFKGWLKDGETKKPAAGQKLIDDGWVEVAPRESEANLGSGEESSAVIRDADNTLRSGGWEPKDLDGPPGEWKSGIDDLDSFLRSTPKQDGPLRVADDASPQIKSLAWTGERGNITGFEYMAVLDGEGKPVAAGTTNNDTAVVVPDLVFAKPFDRPTNNIHHNHPAQSALSVGDMATLSYRSTNQISAIDSTGAIYAAKRGPLFENVIQRVQQHYGPGGSWAILGKNAHRKVQEEFKQIATSAADAIKIHLRPSVKDGRLTIGQANVIYGHAQSVALQKAGFIDYVAHIPTLGDLATWIPGTADVGVAALNRMVKLLNGGSNAFNGQTFRARAASSHQPAGSVRAEDAMAKIQEWAAQSASKQPASSVGNPGSGQGTGQQKLETIPDDAFRRPDGRESTAPEIAAEANRLAAIPRDSTIGKATKLGSYATLPVAMAARDRPSATLFNAVMTRFRRLNVLENEAVPMAGKYFGLKPEGMKRVNQVLEAARLYGLDLPNDGRAIVMRVPVKGVHGDPRPELSKPGQVLALDSAETSAFHGLKDFFQKRLSQMGEALARSRGYDGEFTRPAIQAAIDSADGAGARAKAERAMQAMEMTEEMRRAGYVPFNRYGEYYVRVKPKDGVSGEPGGLWFVPKQSIFDAAQAKLDGSNAQIPVRNKVIDLRRQYPADRFDIETGETAKLGGRDLIMQANIPMLERLFMALDRPGTEANAAALDALMDRLFDIRKAGFRKQSLNVRGYSTDFERSIADYIRQSSAHVSNMEHRNAVDTAYAGITEHDNPAIRSFWKNYMEDLETPDGFGSQALRRVGFFNFLWGSPASAAVNMLQTPTVTLPAVAAWAGPRAAKLVGDAMLDATDALTVGKNGLAIDWSKVGRTDAERAVIAKLRQEGVLDPRMSDEAQGRNVSKSLRLRPYAKRFEQIWDVGASMFGAAEQVNRITAALTHMRAAANPQIVESMRKVYGKDQNFQNMIRNEGLTPESLARFGVDETQFIGGKVNRAPITRGHGAWILQFKPYLLNYLRVMNKQLVKQGWRGRTAFALGVGALGMQSGLFGAPFAQDLNDLATWIYEKGKGIDPLLDIRLKQFAADSAMGDLGAEIVGHGFGRMAGVDISNRTSMGDIIPDGDPLSFAPAIMGNGQRLADAWTLFGQGRPWTAWATLSGLALGKGGENAMKAMALGQEGYATKKGNMVAFPSEITAGDMVARATGFQPTSLSKELEARNEGNRVRESTQMASSKLLSDVSRELALAQDALRSGDKETSDSHYARYRALIAANVEALAGAPDWAKVPPPQARAIKAALQQQLDYKAALLKRTGKTKRSTAKDVMEMSAP